MDFVDLTLKIKCEYCGSSNANIWGTVMSSKLSIQSRCMRCGAILSEVRKTIIDPPIKLAIDA